MPDVDFDPAATLLSPEDYERVCTVAAAVVDLYGGQGPPFPIENLLTLLRPLTLLLPPLGEGRDEAVAGYSFPLDYAVYRKHAAICVNPDARSCEVFVTTFHEAGHVLLHILPDRGAEIGLPYDRRSGPPLSPRHSQAEIEADQFARLTTMPAAWVCEHWPYARTLGDGDREAVLLMAALFGVPAGWMFARLHALRLI